MLFLYLKSIEIQGFKSFPDKTLLTFSDGITAVVGPNGSGKSNIADAIRWVLGEQSVRTLRGGRMEDVIFGGTGRRNRMGFCEVSITVDNGDGSIPVEYTDVTVTRRYYRSGESEFYLNRKSVRLKDIRELFMDTGLGSDGYSMIGQGRIDEILSVKSAERREIFEEAAGISKVRLRREESRKKLEAAEENLVRIRDILAELEDRVGPLKDQAEKAKKYLALRDELRELEVSVSVRELEQLSDSIKSAGFDCDNAKRLLSAKKNELEEKYCQSNELSEKIRQADINLEHAREALEGIRDEISDIGALKAVSEANLANSLVRLQEQQEKARLEKMKNDELLRRLKESEDRRLKILDDLEKVQNTENRLLGELREAADSCNSHDKKLAELLSESENLKEELREKNAGLSSAKYSLKELSERMSEFEAQRTEAALEAEKSRKGLKEAKDQAEKAQEKLLEASNALKGTEILKKNRLEKSRLAEEEFQKVKREREAAEDRLSMLKAMERDYEGFSFAVKKVMQASARLKGIHGPLSALIGTDSDYSAAVETALGSAVQNIVVNDEASAKAAIGYLKAGKLGRATFLPLTSVKPRWGSRRDLSSEQGFVGYADGLVKCDKAYIDIVKSFLGTTAVVDNIDSAVLMGKKYRYSFRIVTLDGQLISAGGAMTGGSLGKSTGALARANEIKALESRIESMADSFESLLAQSREARRRAEAEEYRENVARDELRRVEKEKGELDAAVKVASSSLEARLRDNERLEAEAVGFEERKLTLVDKIKGLEFRSGALEKEIALLDNKLESLGGQHDENAKKTETLRQRLNEVQREKSSLSARAEEADKTSGMMRRLIESSENEEQKTLSAIDMILCEGKKLEEEITHRSKELEDQAKKEKDAREKIEKLTASRLGLDGDKARIERDIQQKSSEIMLKERDCAGLEHKRDQLMQREKAVLDRLWEEYELTRAAASEIYKRNADIPADGARIGRLRGAIKSLGSVNVGAVKEYDEVYERYAFMQAQKDDLEKAKSQLEGITKRLTSGMEEAFAKKFKEINEAFMSTFTEIFGGGSAFLKLEDQGDILECGIDISVEMPGKGTRAISLLSGGEKAFVAIALYFAIIKVSPTPFCVLDEIDAALDEVNVSRFVNYMRTLCGHTQFIVITHRRGTMEGSDILYGATMQEHGVTRLLKLDINEVESRLNIKVT